MPVELKDNNQEQMECVIYIVDDDVKIRRLLEQLFSGLNYVVKSYSNGSGFLADFPLNDFGCILLDLRLPDMGGLMIQKKINGNDCHLPVIFMTSHADNRSAVKAMKAGAFDFVDKPINFQEVLEITQQALQKCQKLNEENAFREAVLKKLNQLTNREKEICRLVGTGTVTKEIAHLLEISPHTVEVHRNNIMKKLGVSTVVDLTRLLLITDVHLFDEKNLADKE